MDLDAVTRLLSLTSHELRSPLGVIRGYLKLLEQQPGTLSEQQRQAVAASLRASERMTELLAEVSALAHLQRGDTAVSRRPTAVTDIARPLLDGASSPDLPIAGTIDADMALLAPALLSLRAAVSGARPQDGHVAVRFHAERRDSSACLVIDIGGETAGAVEQPLNVLRGGLGLRLPLAKLAIELHGGRLAELHRAGRLAAIRLWLPLRS
jgi:signal transduction histidine kinase